MELVLLLAAAISQNPDWEQDSFSVSLSSAIYFTSNGLDMRVKCVDSALAVRLTDLKLFKYKDNDYVDNMSSYWSSILNSLSRQRKTRNKVAHGAAVTRASWDGTTETKLTYPMLHPTKLADNGGALAGLGANELKTSLQSVRRTAQRIHSLCDAILAANFLPEKALLEKLAKLTA